LHTDFKRADPKSVKNTDGLTAFFVLLGSARVKASSGRFCKISVTLGLKIWGFFRLKVVFETDILNG